MDEDPTEVIETSRFLQVVKEKERKKVKKIHSVRLVTEQVGTLPAINVRIQQSINRFFIQNGKRVRVPVSINPSSPSPPHYSIID